MASLLSAAGQGLVPARDLDELQAVAVGICE